MSRADVRSEVTAGRWTTHGHHTVVVGSGSPVGEGRWWHVVWESGSGAVLDGVAALQASGLTGYEQMLIDVSMPRGNRRHRVAGVRRRRPVSMPPTRAAGVPRADVPAAAVNAAAWATSDRQAVLLLCLVLQQRLTTPARLESAWTDGRTRAGRDRRDLLDHVVLDICDGAHSLGELDVAGLCREAGLPEPDRQVVRSLPGGRVYLDLRWDSIGLVVEIDGGHHALALNPVDDALRQNAVVLGGDRVLRVPVLGLRLARRQFLGQLLRAHAQWSVQRPA
ncbi:MAG: hypothetical protein ACRCY8_11685 [Dermatophilaceae bacterium]